jgi:hypothetical protein
MWLKLLARRSVMGPLRTTADGLDDRDLISISKTGCSIVNVTVAVNVTLVDGYALEGTVVSPTQRLI